MTAREVLSLKKIRRERESGGLHQHYEQKPCLTSSSEMSQQTKGYIKAAAVEFYVYFNYRVTVYSTIAYQIHEIKRTTPATI